MGDVAINKEVFSRRLKQLYEHWKVRRVGGERAFDF